MTNEVRPNTIGTNMREARTKLGISQRGAAEAAGLQPHVWCLYENGKREPMLSQIVRIARVLGVQPKDLLKESADGN